MMTIVMLQGVCPWCGAHMGWWGGLGMMLGWLVFLLLVVGLVWLMFRRMPPGSEDRAESALHERTRAASSTTGRTCGCSESCAGTD